MIKEIVNGILFGGLLGGFCSWLLNNFRDNRAPWNVFGFVWFCPVGSITVVLALSLYMATKQTSKAFIHNAIYGLLATIPVLLLTLLLLKTNLNSISIFIINFILSMLVVIVYFKYRIYLLD